MIRIRLFGEDFHFYDVKGYASRADGSDSYISNIKNVDYFYNFHTNGFTKQANGYQSVRKLNNNDSSLFTNDII